MFGVAQPDRHPRLAQEAVARVRAGDHVGADDFDDPELVEEPVADLVDRAHAAFPELLQDLVFTFDVLVEKRQRPTHLPGRQSYPSDRMILLG
jgi:hypothetical protein